MLNRALVYVFVLLLLPVARASAQGDEIQVYDGGLAPVGVFNLTVHNNFTPKGIEDPAFPGAITSHRSLNGVPEWAYGVTSWFEAGLYMPLYSKDRALGLKFDGFKLRTLFGVPHAVERTFFYGANFEFSINQSNWDPNRISSEVRPIVGWHLGRLDVIANPILDTEYDGLKNLQFAPSLRLAWNASERWAVAGEEYAYYGPVRKFLGPGEQSHQIFGVVDYVGPIELQFGAGVGVTDASDRFQLKVIVAKDLNKPRAK